MLFRIAASWCQNNTRTKEKVELYHPALIAYSSPRRPSVKCMWVQSCVCGLDKVRWLSLGKATEGTSASGDESCHPNSSSDYVCMSVHIHRPIVILQSTSQTENPSFQAVLYIWLFAPIFYMHFNTRAADCEVCGGMCLYLC